MLNKKSSSRVSQGSRRTEYLFLPLLLLLTGCSTTNIPGLDRVFFPNSSAKVGPLITSEEQYPENEADSVETSVEQVKPSQQNVDVVDATNTANKAPLPTPELEPSVVTQTAKSKTNSESIAETKSNPTLQATVNEVSTQTSKLETPKAIEEKTTKVTPSVPTTAPVLVKETIKHGSVSGQVIIIADDGKSIAAQGTLVTLTPKKSRAEAEKRKPKTHVIDMQDKEYQPQYSTINAGDQVVFVNKDNIQHNVFSPSGNNAFDLGTYGAGLKRAVTLSEPGIVKVYCNIHADMAMFVAVGDPGMSIQTDDQGRYRIDNVPLGAYDMTIWNIRGETTRTVEVKSSETVKLVDQINTVAAKTETHKNKFGGNYSKNSALFEDEFY